MAKDELYNVLEDKMSIAPEGIRLYRVFKYDKKLLTDTGSYQIRRGPGIFGCECLAKNKPTCRHREIVEIFIDANKVGSYALYDYDRKRWDSREVPDIEYEGEDL